MKRITSITKALITVVAMIVLLAIIVTLAKNYAYYKVSRINDAIEEGNREEINRLIASMAAEDIDKAKKKKGLYHPLNLAAELGDYETVKILVEKGVDINARSKLTGNVPLISALTNMNVKNRCQIANYLLDKGADPNVFNDAGETALTKTIYRSECTREESMELFKRLYNISNIDEIFPNEFMGCENALEMVAAYDMPELVDWLIKEKGFAYPDMKSEGE